MASVHVSRLATWRASLRISFLQFLADPQWLIPSTIAPVMFALAAYEIYQGSGPDLVVYAILGAGMMSMWGQTLYGSGWAIGSDRMWGTLEATLAAPSKYIYIICGRVVWNTVTGLAGGAVVLVVVVAAYHQPLPMEDPLAFLGLFVLILVSLAAVGLVLTAAFVYSRYAGFIQNIGEFAFYVATGCMFPVVLLPFWVTPVSLIFPATWALDALRYACIPGYVGFSWGLEGDLLGSGATIAIYLGSAFLVFHRVERHVLEDGTADEY